MSNCNVLHTASLPFSDGMAAGGGFRNARHWRPLFATASNFNGKNAFYDCREKDFLTSPISCPFFHPKSSCRSRRRTENFSDPSSSLLSLSKISLFLLQTCD